MLGSGKGASKEPERAGVAKGNNGPAQQSGAPTGMERVRGAGVGRGWAVPTGKGKGREKGKEGDEERERERERAGSRHSPAAPQRPPHPGPAALPGRAHTTTDGGSTQGTPLAPDGTRDENPRERVRVAPSAAPLPHAPVARSCAGFVWLPPLLRVRVPPHTHTGGGGCVRPMGRRRAPAREKGRGAGVREKSLIKEKLSNCN